PLWLGAVLVLACLAIILFGRTPMWESDLGRLTPVPQALLLQDSKLRQELGASDIRRMLVVEAPSADEVLTHTEALVPQLDALVKSGDIENYDEVARYLPS